MASGRAVIVIGRREGEGRFDDDDDDDGDDDEAGDEEVEAGDAGDMVAASEEEEVPMLVKMEVGEGRQLYSESVVEGK